MGIKATLTKPKHTPREWKPISVIGPSIAYIPLTRSMYACIDDTDVNFLGKWKWCSFFTGSHWYAVRRLANEGPSKKGKIVLMHRTILSDLGILKGDHVNGSGLDNRRGNLRPANQGQNSQNQKVRSDSKSGLKGAFYHNVGKFYYSRIKVNGSMIQLYKGSSPVEAHEAYCKAAVIHFGQFARLK